MTFQSARKPFSDAHNAAMVPQKIGPADAAKIVERVRKLSGISIDAKNLGFLELRLNRRLRELGINSMDGYIAMLDDLQGATEAGHLVEFLATHTTNFFRENNHYEFLKSTALQELVNIGSGKERPLVIWSAASSIGSELWSAGMILDMHSMRFPGGLRWKLVGTDISQRILHRAATAVFSEQELTGLPDDLRRRYLLRSRADSRLTKEGSVYRIVPELRQKARFQMANLVNIAPDFDMVADVAFLRNVLIYFEQADQQTVIKSVLQRIRKGGYLFLGHAESIGSLPKGLIQIGPSIYRKIEDEA